MTTKEKVKKEIDEMPENLVEEVYEFISNIKSSTPKKKRIHTFKLKGKFDNLNIRTKAYE